MGGWPPNVLWCPDLLADCWWRPFLADGFALEPASPDWWGNRPDDPPDCPILVDLARSRKLFVGDDYIEVLVFRDNGFSGDITKPLWIAYLEVNRILSQWLSRVLVASGAKLWYGQVGYKQLYYWPTPSLENLEALVAQIGMVTKRDSPLDKMSWELSCAGVTVRLYGGSRIDHITRAVDFYLALDHDWRLFGRRKLKHIVNNLEDAFVLLGLQRLSVERYRIVRDSPAPT